VVKFLVEVGIPPERLAATGYGEYQPIDPGISEEALAKNRRIELKFNQIAPQAVLLTCRGSFVRVALAATT
jgi:hypothetical protein